jgi:tRNA A37 threonylcarbamoyladenosine synthetase subunit TsaC/SUA5/YrdC
MRHFPGRRHLPSLLGRIHHGDGVNTRIIAPSHLSEAVAALQRGELIVFPTDTVYGVAALATHADAVARLFAAKKRPPTLALPVMVATADQVPVIAHPLPSFSLRECVSERE